MTKGVEGIVFIEAEKSQQCDMCGKIDELRPYGPNGKKICYDCGMKDPETTSKMFNKLLNPSSTE